MFIDSGCYPWAGTKQQKLGQLNYKSIVSEGLKAALEPIRSIRHWPSSPKDGRPADSGSWPSGPERTGSSCAKLGPRAAGTIVWPNDADIAPETLYARAQQHAAAA